MVEHSQNCQAQSGVPQGIKIGPAVFLAMVNQVATSTPRRWKSVDDVTAGESQAITDQGGHKSLEGHVQHMRGCRPGPHVIQCVKMCHHAVLRWSIYAT